MSQKKGQLKRQRSASFDYQNNDDDKDNTKFEEWMNNIEKFLIKKINLRITDFPDEDFRMNFDEGILSEKMAQTMIDGYFGVF
jgi:hypothetical protein